MREMNEIPPEHAARLPWADRAFLHVQGRATVRGYVVGLRMDESSWDLEIRDVEYLQRDEPRWERTRDRDVYGGNLVGTSFYLGADESVEISSYGMIVHVAPLMPSPWQQYDWPALGRHEGGPMGEGGSW